MATLLILVTAQTIKTTSLNLRTTWNHLNNHFSKTTLRLHIVTHSKTTFYIFKLYTLNFTPKQTNAQKSKQTTHMLGQVHSNQKEGFHLEQPLTANANDEKNKLQNTKKDLKTHIHNSM